MKKIKHDLWTDGEQEYTGNPKDGFKPVNAKPQEEKVVEGEAFNLQAPKTDDSEE